MTGYQTRKLNQFRGKSAFMKDSTADFPPESEGAKTAAKLDQGIDEIEALAAKQNPGAVAQAFDVKDDSMERMIAMLKKMRNAANSLAFDIEGIEELFRIPQKRTNETWLTTARAFYKYSEPYVAEFQKYKLPATFREDLMGYITTIETNVTGIDIEQERKSGATGGLAAKFTETNNYSRKLDGIVENEYFDNPEKKAAWRQASHLEKPPKRTPAPPKPEPETPEDS